MILLISSLISYFIFMLLFIIALTVFRIQDDRKIKFKEILIVIFWPLTIFRGLFSILDDNHIDSVEFVAVINTIVFWVTFICWLTLK